MFGGFNKNKFKPSLKMAVHRIAIVKNKKLTTIRTTKAQIAALLRDGKEEKCRIQVEGLIREDFTVEAYEVLELLCDLLSERMSLIVAEKECPYDMREAVSTLIWSASRTNIPELLEVKKQLTKKYGSSFAKDALANADCCVNERVISRLSIHPPTAELVVRYLTQIALEHSLSWSPTALQSDLTAPMMAPTGSSVSVAAVSGPNYAALYGALGAPPVALPPSRIPLDMPPPVMISSDKGDVEEEEKELPSVEEVDLSPRADTPDFEELSARFEKLRNGSSTK